MKVFSLKMKQKILGVILLVIFMVMIASSLVVSYVIYNQNMDGVNADLAAGAKIIKSEIMDMQTELIRKIGQMDSLFKVSENVKFLADFKTDYDLGMTETGFMDLTSALFATAAANGIGSIALYDAQGELLAFSQRDKTEERLTGYYYVNPEKSFKYTRTAEDADLKKSKWETRPQIEGLSIPVNRTGMIAEKSWGHLESTGNDLALSVYVPVMVDDYNKDTDKMAPKQVGGGPFIQTAG